MTAVDAAAAAAEIASSLTMEEIPMKLRCSVCSLLAVGAVRMPCCDQNLCESCEASLEDECPVCLHTPVDKSLIKANKALRTTIKALLKRKVIEKEDKRKKEDAVRLAASTTTATPEITEAPAVEFTDTQAAIKNGVNGTRATVDVSAATAKDSSPEIGPEKEVLEEQSTTKAQMDIPRPSIETTTDNVQAPTQSTTENNSEGPKADGERRDSGVTESNAEAGDSNSMNALWATNGVAGSMMSNGILGMNGMNGALPMDFSQMMQFMPNAMPNTMMGAFPNMMGIPGMGMDPMAMNQVLSQSMYGGFGGPGMGMNGMNGMNMGMGFNAGQGAFGGFNGQLDAWTTGQDNYNANAYGANGMGGSFGAHAGQGGYNMPSHQGNYNQMHHQQYSNNDFHHGHNNHGFQNRGRGRRGYYNAGRGHGGYNNAMNQGNQNGNANYEPFHQQVPSQALQHDSAQQPQREPLPLVHQERQMSSEPKDEQTVDTAEKRQADEERMNKELNPGDELEEPAAEADSSKDQVEAQKEMTEAATADEPSSVAEEPINETKISEEPDEAKPLPIQTFISSDEARMGKRGQDSIVKNIAMPPPAGPAIPQGPAAKYPQEQPQDMNGWGRGSGRGFYRGASSGRGEYRGRGTSYIPHGNAIHTSPASITPSATFPPVAPVVPKGLGVEGAPTGPKALREGLPNTGIRGGRGFSIVGRAQSLNHVRAEDRVRSRSRSASRHRSRSRSPEASQHRSSHRSRRHRSRSESDEGEREKRRERRRRRSHKYEDEEVDDRDEQRAREASVESSSKRSSHRSHRYHHKEDLGSSSHRHHRDRSRERDRDDDRKHRRKRSRSPTSITQTPTSANVPEFPIAQGKEESRKRRDRDRERDLDEDDDRHRERKRSRRDRSATPELDSQPSSRKGRNREDTHETPPTSATSDSQRTPLAVSQVEKAPPAKPIPTGPRAPEKDHHTLEREARNRERLMKEMQRRAATEGTAPKRRESGLEGRIGARKVSYKYEDEENEEARALRVEDEREAGRWR
ncbi:hypothetical protein MMC13_001836 [Lambiella insularis]|nr:hypothetical protein [Lambiella insularis]